MKKKLVVLILCILTGCVSLSKNIEWAEINKDPIETINLYKQYKIKNMSGVSVPGTRFDCVNGSKSDECIVYRRTMKESKINYFDYKRFLPEDTAIKTETDFLAMVNYYELRHLCDRLEEKTTEERLVRRLARKRLQKCATMIMKWKHLM